MSQVIQDLLLPGMSLFLHWSLDNLFVAKFSENTLNNCAEQWNTPFSKTFFAFQHQNRSARVKVLHLVLCSNSINSDSIKLTVNENVKKMIERTILENSVPY